MPKQTKICRVCGAEYEACHSVRTGSSVFNWREVACSPACGMVYLERITASRKPTVQEEKEEIVLRFPLYEAPILEEPEEAMEEIGLFSIESNFGDEGEEETKDAEQS